MQQKHFKIFMLTCSNVGEQKHWISPFQPKSSSVAPRFLYRVPALTSPLRWIKSIDRDGIRRIRLTSVRFRVASPVLGARWTQNREAARLNICDTTSERTHSLQNECLHRSISAINPSGSV